MRGTLVVLLAFLLPSLVVAEFEDDKVRTLTVGCKALLSVKIVVLPPTRPGKTRGDVIFFHGFADRSTNHIPLFADWRARGFRVIAPDLPSHGGTKGMRGLDLFTFRQLADILISVEKTTREDAERPLFVSGWSTGGLIAVRMAQWDLWKKAGRKLTAMVLLTPGVAVHPLVGEWGVVTARTLTRNPNPGMQGPLRPSSPFLRPVFASQLLYNAWAARQEGLPPDVPTLVLLAGEKEDRYVRTSAVRDWARVAGPKVWILEFPGAFHQLDEEPDGIAEDVRETTGWFFEQALN